MNALAQYLILEKYIYTAEMAGALNYPIVLMEILMIPVAFRVNRIQKRELYHASMIQQKAFYAICIAAALFIGLVDYSLAGVIQRYLADILPLLITVSVIAILAATGEACRNKFKFIMSVGAMTATTVFCLLLQLSDAESNINLVCPNLYDTIADTLQFWR